MADMVIEPAGSDDDFDDDYGFNNNETYVFEKFDFFFYFHRGNKLAFI